MFITYVYYKGSLLHGNNMHATGWIFVIIPWMLTGMACMVGQHSSSPRLTSYYTGPRSVAIPTEADQLILDARQLVYAVFCLCDGWGFVSEAFQTEKEGFGWRGWESERCIDWVEGPELGVRPTDTCGGRGVF